MTYAAAEAALLTTLRLYSSGTAFTTANSSRGDFRVLDAEGHDYGAVISQRARSTYSDRGADGRGSHGKRQHRHAMRITLGYKRSAGEGGDGIAYAALQTLADALQAHLDLYPRLGGGVASIRRAEVVEASEVLMSESGALFLKRLEVDVASEADWAPAEAAR
jgi:hypothetical protein